MSVPDEEYVQFLIEIMDDSGWAVYANAEHRDYYVFHDKEKHKNECYPKTMWKRSREWVDVTMECELSWSTIGRNYYLVHNLQEIKPTDPHYAVSLVDGVLNVMHEVDA